MKAFDAIIEVLQEEGGPLRVDQITRRILAQNLWQTSGQTPEATVEARIAVDIKEHGTSSRLQRVEKRTFALRSWHLPEYFGKPFRKKTTASEFLEAAAPLRGVQTEYPVSMSFTDAAKQILGQYGNRQPMNYRDITDRALQLGLIKTHGQTPAQTMYAQILTEIERNQKRGESGRFTKHGRGMFGLSNWADVGLASEIEQHNNEVRQKLRERLHAVAPGEFEDLIGSLLTKIGFESVQVTSRSNDGGVDVRGTLVVAGVIRTNMAVQAKRWKYNVQTPIVQQVRGSLGTHDQGLIITTSDFSSGARKEAERSNAVPVALMNGEQLVALLVEYNIGITRITYDLIELGSLDEE
ncbi:MAG: restriction endonuclease [Chloroflexi bacterium]|nr:restriction endonuclease [Chloroflexota bacterium]